MELARFALVSGQAGTSVQFARDAVRNDPGSLPAQAALVRGLVAGNDLTEAERQLAGLLVKHPDAAELHVLRALAYTGRQDAAAARRFFQRALELDPESTEALGGLVALESVAGSPAAARERVSSALASAPNRPDLLLIAARAAVAARDLDGAEAHLRQAVQIDPALLPGYIMLGQLYFAQRKLDKARVEFEAIAERQARPLAALTMLGIIAQIHGDLPAAERQFEKALTVNPAAPIAANNLAWLYADRGEKLEMALQYAKTAATALPKIPETHDTLGWVYFKLGLMDRAVPAFKEAIKLAPKNPGFHYRLGLSYAAAEDPVQARQALERSLALDPNFGQAGAARAALARLAGRYP